MKKIIFSLIFVFFFNIGILNALTLEDIENESKVRSYCRIENIDNIPLEIKIAQMLFLGWDLSKVNNKDLKEYLNLHYIGGLQFYSNNISKDKKIKNFLDSLKKQKTISHFISVDDKSSYNTPLTTLVNIGVNLVKIPTTVQNNFDNIFNFVKNSNKSGVILAINDFTANTTTNTMSLLITKGKYNQFIVPNNSINKEIDSNNYYSLSTNGLNNYLRGKLNFQGIILNNSLASTDIISNISLDEVIIKAIKSGNNMIFYNGLTLENNKLFVQNVTKIIKDGLKNNLISIKDINNSYIKIIGLKHQFCIVPREKWC